MKVNVFSIPVDQVPAVKEKMLASGMAVIKEVDQDGWHGEFFYSIQPTPSEIAWVKTYESYFEDISIPTNTNYYALFLFTRGPTCFALSYGKTHFYLKNYCDYDFGIELCKRIASEFDIRQTASKRFQGKKKKDIRSFASNTRLDVESGESVDYLQASIVSAHVPVFGKSGRFGTSAQLSPEVAPPAIGAFLSEIEQTLSNEPAFVLPRTIIVSDPFEIEHLDAQLIKELTSPIGTTDFAHNSYDLYGVDFVFASDGTFKLRCPGYPQASFEDLTMRDLKGYIISNKVSVSDVLKIKVTHENEGRPRYTEDIKQALDYVADEERVLLSNGRWMRFNQDYLQFLDEFIGSIRIEETEPQFRQITIGEPEFNGSNAILQAGYEKADKDFSIFRTRSSTPIEAWDLKKDTCVYAVKFGTAQKIGYVCDQATAVLELIRNKAGVTQVPEFKQYCLWLGYKSKNDLSHITQTGSIILKQKIETWARKAMELGIEPVIKLSRKVTAAP